MKTIYDVFALVPDPEIHPLVTWLGMDLLTP